MAAEDPTLETKCENLMNIVVESRKRFGKTSNDYYQKILLMENKLLNLQVETVTNYRFKPKNTITSIEDDNANDMDAFLVEISEKRRRLDDLRMKLKNTQEIILQLEGDSVGKKLRAPLSAEALLAKAKAKSS